MHACCKTRHLSWIIHHCVALLMGPAMFAAGSWRIWQGLVSFFAFKECWWLASAYWTAPRSLCTLTPYLFKLCSVSTCHQSNQLNTNMKQGAKFVATSNNSWHGSESKFSTKHYRTVEHEAVHTGAGVFWIHQCGNFQQYVYKHIAHSIIIIPDSNAMKSPPSNASVLQNSHWHSLQWY